MQTVLIVIHLLIVLAMIGVILLQKSEGGALGIGGGGGFLTTRGTANALTITTRWLAVIFFITSLSLSILAGWGRQGQSIVVPPSGPQAPAGDQGGGILDQLKQRAPSGPQVPQSK